jgi:hypothetical protein
MGIYRSINMDAVGGGSNTPYITAFLVGTWSLNAPVYEIDYSAATHGKGTSVNVQVYEKVGAIYKEVQVDIEQDASGNVKITIPSATDLRFEGKIIILGE